MRFMREMVALVVGVVLAIEMGCAGGQDVTKAAQPSNPKIESFKAKVTDLHIGDAPKFTAVFAAGKASLTDNGTDLNIAITSGVEFSAPAITKLGKHTYVLTVTGTPGTSAPAKTITDQVEILVTASVTEITPADGYQTVKKTKEYTATSSLADPTVTWSTEGGTGTWDGNKWTAPNWTATYTIRATAKDGTYTSTSVRVINMPAGSLSVSSAKPLFGATVDITPTINGVVNGSATLGFTQGGTEITDKAVSGTAYTTPAIKSGTTIWLRATNAAGDFVDYSTVVTPQVVSVEPIASSAQYIVVGDPVTFTTAVTHAQDTTVTWAATGTATGPAGSWSANVWTAPLTPGDYTITATANADGVTSQSTVVHVVDNPKITSFLATMNPVAYGDHASMVAVFEAGDGTVDQGVGTVKSGVPFDSGAITGDRIYTLTVKSPSGRSVSKALAMSATPVTITPIIPGGAVATPGAAVRFQASAGGAADNSVVWTASGGTMTPDGIWLAPSAPGIYTVKATSKANSAISSSTTAGVKADPVITSLTASSDTVLYGGSVQLTPTFAGGVGSIDQGIGLVNSGAVITAPVVKGTTTYTLTVVNTTDQTNLIANADGEAGIIGQAIGAHVGLIQDPDHAHGGSWTRAFVLEAQTSQAIQNSIPVTQDQAFTLDAWHRSTTDLTSAVSLQLVWVDAAGKVLSSSNASFSPQVGAWQRVTVFGKAPAGATGVIPTFASDTVGAEVGQSVYLDDLVMRRLVQKAVIVRTSDLVISAVSPANATMSVGKTLAFTATVTGAVDTAVRWSAEGPGGVGSWNGTVWTAPNTPGIYTITAASDADPSVKATVKVTVVAMPNIVSLTPASTLVPMGSSTTIIPVFTDGLGQVDSGVGPVATGVPFSTGPLSAVTRFTLTVTNAAGDFVSASVDIGVKAGAMTPLAPPLKLQTLTKAFQVGGGVVSGVADASVIWSVGGVDGGNATYGTISPTGYYTAPTVMPGANGSNVVIRCRSTADPSLFQEMTVNLWNMPVVISFTVE